MDRPLQRRHASASTPSVHHRPTRSRSRPTATSSTATAPTPNPRASTPDGQPCHRQSTGLLQRRPVVATEISYIGKESNRLEETTAGLIHDPTEILSSYSDPNLDRWRTLVVPTLREFNTAEIAERANLDRRTIQRLLSGTHYPRRGHRQTLTAVAADLARANLEESGIEPPRAALAILRLHNEMAMRPVRTCAICGTPLDNPRQLHCGPTCKKRAYRGRLRDEQSDLR